MENCYSEEPKGLIKQHLCKLSAYAVFSTVAALCSEVVNLLLVQHFLSITGLLSYFGTNGSG